MFIFDNWEWILYLHVWVGEWVMIFNLFEILFYLDVELLDF
jgi:hypothetical protein